MGGAMSENDDVWKRRFFTLMLARLAGSVLILLGLVIAFSDTFQRGGNPLAGLFFCAAGLVGLVLFPALLRRHWQKP
jgi:drug/metabolite transporter (DMT)-like permease